MLRNQWISRFQLTLFWSTSLRSPFGRASARQASEHCDRRRLPRRSGDLSRHSAEGATAEAAEAGLFAPERASARQATRRMPRRSCEAAEAGLSLSANRQKQRHPHPLRPLAETASVHPSRLTLLRL